LARRHTTLLIAIVATTATRPFLGDNEGALLVFSFALLLVLLAALFTTQIDDLVGERVSLLAQNRRRRIIAWTLAIPAIGERVYVIIAPSPRIFIVSALCWFLFFGFVTWSHLRTLLKHREVSSETIAMSISIYLLLGLTWGMLYIVIFQSQPDAFSFGPAGAGTVAPDRQHALPVFIYFSLTTLSTVGFGDITPVTLMARYAAVAEGIVGQLYLAILVARLVGMRMSRATSHVTPPSDR
jgi:hypothetical protein